MSEKEREEELFKRAEKREMLKKRYEIEKKLKMQKKKSKVCMIFFTLRHIDSFHIVSNNAIHLNDFFEYQSIMN